MAIKYRTFWFEQSEDGTFYYQTIYYNGTQASQVKSLTESGSIRKAQHWVNDYGYDWLNRGSTDED